MREEGAREHVKAAGGGARLLAVSQLRSSSRSKRGKAA